MSLIIDMLKDVDKRLQTNELPPGLLKKPRFRLSLSLLPPMNTLFLTAILMTLVTTLVFLARVKPVHQIASIPAEMTVKKSILENGILPDKWANPVNITSVTFETKKDIFEIRFLLTNEALYTLKQTAGNHLQLTIENAKLQADLPALVGYDMIVKTMQASSNQNNTTFVIDLNHDAMLLAANLQQENNSNELVITVGKRDISFNEPVKQVAANLASNHVSNTTSTHSIKSPTEQGMAIVQYERAIKLAESGNQQEAVDILMKLLQTYPDYHDARVTLSAIILNNGNTIEARKIVDDGLEISPDYTPLLELKSRILTSEGKIHEALLLLQSEHPEMNEAPDYYALTAALLNRTEKYKEAADLYQKLVVINPHDGALWFGLGVALDKLGNNKEALLAYRKASMEGKLSHPALAFLQNRLNALQEEIHVES